jgi:hypothetical protein
MRLVKLLLISTLLWSCHTSITRTNDEEHMKRGVAFARNFYSEVLSGNVSGAIRHMGSSIGQEDGLKLLNTIRELRGDLDSVQTISTGSKFAVVNGDTSEMYSLELRCFYSKGTTTEELVIETEGDSLKIVGYHFNL